MTTTTTKTTALPLTDDANCFVCGKSNTQGLQMTWKTKGNVTEADFYPSRVHQGWQGLVHGGILATVLDEAMTRLAWQLHGGAVTCEMTVRYYKPARIGEHLRVKGEVSDAHGRIIPAKSEIRNADGVLIASATGKAFVVKE